MAAVLLRRAERGWWIPWAFVSFFAVVFAVNGVMIWLAVVSWTGLETTDAYERGLAYNRALAAARAQAALGWQADFSFVQTGPRRGRLELGMRDRGGAPLTAARIDAELVRPSEAGYDFTLELAEGEPGRYRAEFELPFAGQWEVRLAAQARGEVYLLSPRIYVRP